jgi:hypothetical protein
MSRVGMEQRYVATPDESHKLSKRCEIKFTCRTPGDGNSLRSAVGKKRALRWACDEARPIAG